MISALTSTAVDIGAFEEFLKQYAPIKITTETIIIAN
jgi:hypothetical protein